RRRHTRSVRRVLFRSPQPTEGFTSILHVVFSCLGLLSGIHPLIFTRLANLILLGTVPLIALASLRSHWRQAPALSLLPLALYLHIGTASFRATSHDAL